MQRDRQTHRLTGNRTDAGPFSPCCLHSVAEISPHLWSPQTGMLEPSPNGNHWCNKTRMLFFCQFSSSETKYLSFSNKPLMGGFKRAGELRPLLLSKLDTVLKLIKPTEVQLKHNLTSSTDSVKDPDGQVGWIRGNQAISTCCPSFHCTFSAPRTAKRQTEPTHGTVKAQVPAVCSRARVWGAVVLTRYSDSDCRQRDQRGCYS